VVVTWLKPGVLTTTLLPVPEPAGVVKLSDEPSGATLTLVAALPSTVTVVEVDRQGAVVLPRTVMVWPPYDGPPVTAITWLTGCLA